MEINSLHSASSFLFKENSRKANQTDFPQIEEQRKPDTFHVFEDEIKRIDFTSISPRELRDIAQEYYQLGQIGQDTYSELSTQLPDYTMDAGGEIVDITHVTDDTNFDFSNYFHNRLEVARSIGSPDDAKVLETVMSFISAV